MPGRCGAVLRVLHDEFLCKNFGFNFSREDVFYTSQWAWPRFVFILYRLTLATYSLIVLVYSIIGFDHGKWRFPWPVWLTNWSYLILTLHLLLAAVLALFHSRGRGSYCSRFVPRVGHSDTEESSGEGEGRAGEEQPELRRVEEGSPSRSERNATENLNTAFGEGEIGDGAIPANVEESDTGVLYTGTAISPAVDPSKSPPAFRRTLRWYFQLDWLLFAVSTCAAFLVTLVYFGGLYPSKKQAGLSEADINLHLMNSVMVALELCVCAVPVRLLHFVYVLAYFATYVVFSGAYFAADRNATLYPGVLDWNHPDTTGVVLVVVAVAVVPLLVLLLFGAYQLRLCVYRRVYGVE